MVNLDREKLLKYEAEIRELQSLLKEIIMKDIDEFVLDSMEVRLGL